MNLKSLVRAVLFPFALGLAFASFAFGDDANDSKATSETSHDVSKNPLTGNTTETTTTETHAKMGANEKKTKSVHKKKFNKHGAKVKEESETTSESQH